MVGRASRGGGGVSINVKLKDIVLRKITKSLDEYSKLKIEIGYYGQDGEYENGTPISAVASWHEFGTTNMPQRSFMRSAFRENERVIKRATVDATRELMAGKIKPVRAASLIAHVMAKAVYTKLVHASSWATPLADSTVAAKGHARILYETGLLRDNLTWRVISAASVVAEGKAKNVRT